MWHSDFVNTFYARYHADLCYIPEITGNRIQCGSWYSWFHRKSKSECNALDTNSESTRNKTNATDIHANNDIYIRTQYNKLSVPYGLLGCYLHDVENNNYWMSLDLHYTKYRSKLKGTNFRRTGGPLTLGRGGNVSNVAHSWKVHDSRQISRKLRVSNLISYKLVPCHSCLGISWSHIIVQGHGPCSVYIRSL